MRLKTIWDAIVEGAASRDVAAGDELSDRGSAIIAVVAFGMLALLAIGNIVGGIVVEHRAVEDSLAQTRLYWAAMGHATYLVSRTGGSGPCIGSCADPQVMAAASRITLAEISGLQVWQYPELGNPYRFRVHPTVTADPRSYKDTKGKVMFEAHFHAADSAAAKELQALRTVSATRPVELRYCVADDIGQQECTGDDKDAKTSWIVSVHRPAMTAAKAADLP